MNDINVKVEESPNLAESPAAAGAIEVDPLAVDDGLGKKDTPVGAAPDEDRHVEDQKNTSGRNAADESVEIHHDVEDSDDLSVSNGTDDLLKTIAEITEVKLPSVNEGNNKVTESLDPLPISEVKCNEDDPPTPDLNSPNPQPEITVDPLQTAQGTIDTAETVDCKSDILDPTEETTKIVTGSSKSNQETIGPASYIKPLVTEGIKSTAEATKSKQEKEDIKPEISQKPETLPLILNTKPHTLEVKPQISAPAIVAILSPEMISNLQSQKMVPEVPQVKSTDVEMVELPPQRTVPTPPVQPSMVEVKKFLEKEVREKKTEVLATKGIEKEAKPAPASQVTNVNGDVAKEDQTTKRRASEESETESPLKKLCLEVEKTFGQHDSMVNDYIQTTTKNNIDEIQRHTEQLLAEIQTLRELAQKKEYEWNNILHLKKVKEEILLRLLRRKQVLLFEKTSEVNGSERITDPFDYLNQAKNLAIDKSDEISGLSIKQPGPTSSPMMQAPVMPVTSLQSHFNPMSGLPPPYDKAAQPHMSMPKPVFPQQMMMPGPMPGFPRDMNGQLPTNFGMPMGRQGPTKDVKSIIADYRQRNPDITPRRGRRMKSILNPNMMNAPRSIAPKVDGVSNLNNFNNLNMLFSNLDMNQKAMLERLQQLQAGGLQNSIFKDALVQFANMQQGNPLHPPPPVPTRPDPHAKERRRESRPPPERPHEVPERPTSSPRLPPPPYPEISLLPVTPTPAQENHSQNSLLHGILTKTPSPATAGTSPTLARLLTSPEHRAAALTAYPQAKNCGEITITPVQPTQPPETQPEKTEEVVQLDEEESQPSEGEAVNSPAGSAGRLVIDEGGADSDTPLCQGCKRRDAQFVCAGCANQWYCSRDCQVAAWDEHSEMCSG